jgi:putative FmdB family regulatory protein
VPTYDYQCRSCGRTIEVIHSMSEDGPSVCEVCGGDLRRVFHPTGIIFKGSGFYKTDSRSSGSASVTGGKRSSGKDSADGAKPASSGDSAGKPASGGESAGKPAAKEPGSSAPTSGSGD